ncbi:helicase-exonuclease AddAB subunit AddB [Marinicrinis lubricantis]|uniref:ATP-dependent helicase/deoxyribonuclease subunit B n=1 Tax=Marinicrinis lubricantis TaxID=2086470 RepID=A0ABW1IUU1_9BACL
MGVELILGRAGSGKTEWVLGEMAQKMKQEPLGSPLIYLVPEQASFQGELALNSRMGLSGSVRAQVLSFQRLAHRVMQETGGTARLPIDDLGKTMLLHLTMKRNQERLLSFRHSGQQLGTMERMLDLFNEFKRYCVTPEVLRTIQAEHQDWSDKLADLHLIYEQYEALLLSQYIDSEEVLHILAQQVEQSAYLQSAEIWIDGFHGFTPLEYVVIAKLMKHCSSVHITFCVDRDYETEEKVHEFALFYPAAANLIRMKKLIEEHSIKLEGVTDLNRSGETPHRFKAAPMLAHLEKHYGSRKRYGSGKELDDWSQQADLQLFAASGKRTEIEHIAREMIRLAREEGARWRDILIVSRNLSSYEDVIAGVLEDHGIPYFLDQNRKVSQHPLIEFIRSALETVVKNWRYDSVFRCIRTEFLLPLEPVPELAGADSTFDLLSFGAEFEVWPLKARRGMDELENYVLAFGIQGSKWVDKKPWTSRFSLSSFDSEQEADEAEKAFLHRIEVYRSWVVKPLDAFQRRVKRADNVKEFADALFQLLDEVGAQERLERWSREAADQGEPEQAREHLQIWNSVMDVLDQLVEVMGEETLPLEWLSELLSAGLDQIQLGLVPPAIDQVVVGSMERTRPGVVKYLFMVGVNDGVIPAKLVEDGILSEDERERFAEQGIEVAPSSKRKLLDEQFMLYTTFTVPSARLYVSYPLADEEGKSLLPSEFVRRLEMMFPMCKIQFCSPEPYSPNDVNEQLGYIARPLTTLTYLVQQLRQWIRGADIHDAWWDVYNWYTREPLWQPLLKSRMYGLFYTNQEQRLSADTSRRLYGVRLRASVSRMERFAACPFSHFASYGLKLIERKLYRLEAPDIGQLFHAALTLIAVDLGERGVEWGDLTAEECMLEAEKAVEQLSPKLQSEILLSSKRYDYISRKLKNIVGRASVVLGEQAKRGSFSPVGLEIGFGTGQKLPPLVMKLDNGCEVELIGRIDRVDQAEGDGALLLRVIDYKSSSTSLQLQEVYYGLSLQLLTYLDVAITHAEKWLGKQAQPAGVLYFHVHNPLLQKERPMDEDKAKDELFKRYKMKGLVLSDLDIIQKMDKQLEKGYSDILPVGLKSDGDFYRSSSVVSLQQWGQLRDYVRGQIKHTAEEILDGNVDIQPYQFGKKTPCGFCPYHAVCQFDPLYEHNDYRKLPALEQEEIWKRIAEETAE